MKEWEKQAQTVIRQRMLQIEEEIRALAMLWTLLGLGEVGELKESYDKPVEKAAGPRVVPFKRKYTKRKPKSRVLSAAGRRAIAFAQRKRRIRERIEKRKAEREGKAATA